MFVLLERIILLESFNLSCLLRRRNCLGHVDGSDPTVKDKEPLAEWEAKDAWVMFCILSFVNPHFILNMRSQKIVKDVGLYEKGV